MPDTHHRPDLPAPGDLIWIRRHLWRVQATHSEAGLTRVRVRAAGHADSRTFLLPADQWWRDQADRTRRVSARYARAWLAARAARLHPAGAPATILRANTTLLAYQLEPALAVLTGARRVLIADAVGLGKTVQAALVIAEVLARHADGRALVLAPAALIPQWADELAARFHLASRVADTATFARLRAERPYLTSPWSSPGVWLASPDYLKQPHVREAMPRAPWDVVVIDEAHTMAGDSLRGDAAHAIARTAAHVVLLTATPHDGDETRFRRLIALGATGSGADTLRTFRRMREFASRRVRVLRLQPGPAVARVLAAIDAFERTVRPDARADHRHALHLLCSLFRKRALSSLAALGASLDRRLAWVCHREPIDTWSQPGLFPDDVLPRDEWAALTSDAGLPVTRERAWLQGLRHLAVSVTTGDPKLLRLRTLLRRADEPAVVFTEYRDSLTDAADVLSAGRRLAVLHGGLTPAEQRRALRAFLDGHADTLLATDVASQGLNLQHRARWVICLDLPWTPMRLEQRVGRVDRIGQTRAVHVTVLGTRHAADEALRERMAERQDASALAPLASCRRWTRAAEGLASLFARQRALDARWRGPDPIRIPRAAAPSVFLHRVCGAAVPAPSPITIVEIPLVDATGNVIERHLGWHCGEPHASAAPPPALVRRARALDARARRRLARLQAARHADAAPAPIQPGLFDARALVTPSRTGATRIDDRTATDAMAGVHAGPPRPVLVLQVRGARR